MKETHDSSPNFIERMIYTENVVKNFHNDEVVLWKINPTDMGSVYGFLNKTLKDENTVFSTEKFLGVGLDPTCQKSYAVGFNGFYAILEQF